MGQAALAAKAKYRACHRAREHTGLLLIAARSAVVRLIPNLKRFIMGKLCFFLDVLALCVSFCVVVA